ncbi:MAG: archease [Candidatus Sericytochromatia bacterium]|nr:archease [Candidatus Sericytochromatia bacterium]
MSAATRSALIAGISARTAGYRLLPHPADIGLAFWGPTRAAAFAQAAYGLTALLGGVCDDHSRRRAVNWQLAGHDDSERLVDLLSRLVWSADAEGRLFSSFRVDARQSEPVRVTAAGHARRRSGGYDVKAVTYHQLAFQPSPEGWAGQVFFDV